MNLNEICNNYRKLFTKFFIQNCEIEEQEVTNNDLKTIDELDNQDIQENLSELMTELLLFKKKYLNTDKSDLAKENVKLEIAAQKYENDIHSHVAIELQLKKVVEEYLNRNSDIEKKNIELSKKIQEQEILISEKCLEIDLLKSRKSFGMKNYCA